MTAVAAAVTGWEQATAISGMLAAIATVGAVLVALKVAKDGQTAAEVTAREDRRVADQRAAEDRRAADERAAEDRRAAEDLASSQRMESDRRWHKERESQRKQALLMHELDLLVELAEPYELVSALDLEMESALKAKISALLVALPPQKCRLVRSLWMPGEETPELKEYLGEIRSRYPGQPDRLVGRHEISEEIARLREAITMLALEERIDGV